MSVSGYNYRDVGVDIDVGNNFVHVVQQFAKSTARAGTLAQLGGFGALFDLQKAGYHDPILVSAADGVGTKLKIATAVDNFDTIGIDLVAMSVNDLVVHGAEPLFFLDYIATRSLNIKNATRIVAGIAEGCCQAGCALVGGETAEMPGTYAEGDYDLAGFAVGAVERGCVLTGQSVVPGDIVLGLASDGLHANGYSMVRHVVATQGLSYTDPAPFASGLTLGEALLVPTRIYVQPCLTLMRAGLVKALAHITGGGLLENVPRVIPDSCAVALDATTWALPPVFHWIAQHGPVALSEMVRIFNCGIGMIAIITPFEVEHAIDMLAANGVPSLSIGVITPRNGDRAITISGMEVAWHV